MEWFFCSTRDVMCVLHLTTPFYKAVAVTITQGYSGCIPRIIMKHPKSIFEISTFFFMKWVRVVKGTYLLNGGHVCHFVNFAIILPLSPMRCPKSRTTMQEGAPSCRRHGFLMVSQSFLNSHAAD